MRSGPPSPGKNNDIEILRAFAILYTIILHFRVLLGSDSILLTPHNFLDLSVGVDLFLVISGFVITGSIIESTGDSAATRRALMFSFWIKRIFRLLPAAWTWVAIACAAQFFVLAVTDIPYQPRDILLSVAAALGNLMNLYTPFCIASGGGQACIVGNYVGHYWSLSLEEQFYLVFPFLFFFLSRKALVGLLVVAIVAQFFWQRPFFTYPWYFKTDALCWGIGLALFTRTGFYHRHLPLLFMNRRLAAASGLVLLGCLPLLAAQVQGIGGYMKPYGVGLVALFCAAIVWLASYDRNTFSIGPRYQRVMLYLGSRSYSLYLAHLIVFLTSRDLFGAFGQDLAMATGAAGFNTIMLAVALGLTLLGAELTYRFVESVMRSKGRVIAARVVANNHQG
ncbi:MAG: acyltransferase [Halioglobus sp.]|nr:acyltransferase [Halioglobus sp.]